MFKGRRVTEWKQTLDISSENLLSHSVNGKRSYITDWLDMMDGFSFYWTKSMVRDS